MGGLSFQWEQGASQGTSPRGSFFDKKKITDAVARAVAVAQSRFGAYAMRVMKNSLKYKTGTSAPGAVPFAHKGQSFSREKKNKKTGAVTRQQVSPLRELIYFARDPSTNSVVDPIVFGAGGASVLEHGGTERLTDRRLGASRTVAIAKHPFALPAGVTATEKLPDLLRRMVN